MTCLYMHKLCKAGCDNHVCRAFFPEKQPIINKLSKDTCMGDEYTTECLIYAEGIRFQEEKRLKGRTEKCPFASNTVCSHPWEWWCKGGEYPFLLNPYITKEGKPRIALRDENNEIQFIPQEYDINETCLSGDTSIYIACPHYKVGVEMQELVRRLNSEEK